MAETNTKRCTGCKEIKPLTEFHKCTSRKSGLQVYCKTCQSSQHREYSSKNREKLKEYQRNHTLGTTNDIFYGIHKRFYPKQNLCELCNKYAKKLSYHHFEEGTKFKNGDFVMGVWLCSSCHHVVHFVDREIFKQYDALKKAILENKGEKYDIRTDSADIPRA